MSSESTSLHPSLRQVTAGYGLDSSPVLHGLVRRLRRERRRRKIGRAYDMALEIARLIPKGSEVLDVGCGNGFIAHHLSAIVGNPVVGIDVMPATEAPIDYRRYDGKHFPVADNSFDAVLLCYVLHHARDAQLVLNEVRRVLRKDGLAIIYEDIPLTAWDQAFCRIHNWKWQARSGPCRFRNESQWHAVFAALGFEMVNGRRLSRWRNVSHPVARRLFCFQLSGEASGAMVNREVEAPTCGSLQSVLL